MTPLDSAISYAHRARAVFPVRPGTKTPLVEHGHHDATTARPVIERMWQRWPDAGVGIACRPSGLLVVDVDPRNGGDDSLADLERQHGRRGGPSRAVAGCMRSSRRQPTPHCAMANSLKGSTSRLMATSWHHPRSMRRGNVTSGKSEPNLTRPRSHLRRNGSWRGFRGVEPTE